MLSEAKCYKWKGLTFPGTFTGGICVCFKVNEEKMALSLMYRKQLIVFTWMSQTFCSPSLQTQTKLSHFNKKKERCKKANTLTFSRVQTMEDPVKTWYLFSSPCVFQAGL